MSTPTLDRDEQRHAELGYKQELNRSWSAFQNFGNLVHDHLDPRRMPDDLLPGLETTRPGCDLLGLADHLGVHPDHRLLHGPNSSRRSPGGRILLVVVKARSPSGVGSPAGSTYSA